MIKILAIDASSGDSCSVALQCGDLIFERCVFAPQDRTGAVLPMIQAVLHEADLTIGELDCLTFSGGPGSFTGIRLTSSIIQGFTLVFDQLPTIRVSTLQLIAQEIAAEESVDQLIVVQDAKMGEVYWGEYRIDHLGLARPLQPDRIVKLENLNLDEYWEFACAGDGYSCYPSLLDAKFSKIAGYSAPQAKYLLPLAKEELKHGGVIDPEKSLPTYLRDESAWL